MITYLLKRIPQQIKYICFKYQFKNLFYLPSLAVFFLDIKVEVSGYHKEYWYSNSSQCCKIFSNYSRKRYMNTNNQKSTSCFQNVNIICSALKIVLPNSHYFKFYFPRRLFTRFTPDFSMSTLVKTA